MAMRVTSTTEPSDAQWCGGFRVSGSGFRDHSLGRHNAKRGGAIHNNNYRGI